MEGGWRVNEEEDGKVSVRMDRRVGKRLDRKME